LNFDQKHANDWSPFLAVHQQHGGSPLSCSRLGSLIISEGHKGIFTSAPKNKMQRSRACLVKKALNQLVLSVMITPMVPWLPLCELCPKPGQVPGHIDNRCILVQTAYLLELWMRCSLVVSSSDCQCNSATVLGSIPS
jgi:hypothetical protein